MPINEDRCRLSNAADDPFSAGVMLDFQLVVPAYNESKTLTHIIERFRVAATAAGFTSSEVQLVVVENGSSDDSARVLADLQKSADSPWFSVVNVPVNRGYGYGIQMGLRATTGRYVGWSHADMQCEPADAFRALKLLRESGTQGNSLVKGRRFGRALRERIVSRLFEFLARVILGVKVNEMNAQPKVFSRALLDQIENPPDTFAFDLYVLFRAAKSRYQVLTVDVAYPPRIHGLSNWAGHFASRYKTIFGIVRYMWALRSSEGRI